MINFFSKNKIIFYLTNLFFIILYIFPGSLLGCIFKDDCDTQPKLTSDFSTYWLSGLTAIKE